MDLHECPKCGSSSTKMKVTGAKWHCFYCGKNGQLDGVDPDSQRQKAGAIREGATRGEESSCSMGGTQDLGRMPPHQTPRHSRLLQCQVPGASTKHRWRSSVASRLPVRRRRQAAVHRVAVQERADRSTHGHPQNLHQCPRSGEGRAQGPGHHGRQRDQAVAPQNSEHLAVGEGIENVLAAVQLGIADPPAWASTVANNLSRVPVIPGIKQLTILADNDVSCTGEQHARGLRRRWLDHKRKVLVKIPTQVGKDFNDILRGQS